MTDIVLTTLNAKYIHASFGIRYLYANLGELRERATIHESTIHERPIDIAEFILAYSPKIIGIGVYIWNAVESLKLIRLIKSIKPDTIIVIGGPEVSYEIDSQEIVKLADYTICGEGDLTFKNLCTQILNGDRPSESIIRSPIPKPEELALPYQYYNQDDIENRVVYVEASRGCPFTCEFCLSSLDIPVRAFDLDSLLPHFQILLDKGLKQFKFVDRTFNLNLRTSKNILEFFLERYHPGLFIHFEMIPDRLPSALRDLISKFPKGALQFEVGIQTFNPEVSTLINRKQDYNKIEENLIYLRTNTGVHIHADLIVGLPGEDLDSFATGFNKLVKLNPQEIQVGILKRLRGTSIARHNEKWQMVYSSEPPYEILKNSLITFENMQKISRFSRYWDLVANSGRFVNTLPLLWSTTNNPYAEFMLFSEFLFQKVRSRSSIALDKLQKLFFEYLINEKKIDKDIISKSFICDYRRNNMKSWPELLPKPIEEFNYKHIEKLLPERQRRHG